MRKVVDVRGTCQNRRKWKLEASGWGLKSEKEIVCLRLPDWDLEMTRSGDENSYRGKRKVIRFICVSKLLGYNIIHRQFTRIQPIKFSNTFFFPLYELSSRIHLRLGKDIWARSFPLCSFSSAANTKTKPSLLHPVIWILLFFPLVSHQNSLKRHETAGAAM